MSDANNDIKISGNIEWCPQKQLLTSAIKYDGNKAEYHHFSPLFLDEVAKVLTFGSKKYSDYNWRAGFLWSRPFNAAMRHLWAWWGGQDKDPETGLSHLAHAACCLMMLIEFEHTKPKMDNRYKGDKNDQETKTEVD